MESTLRTCFDVLQIVISAVTMFYKVSPLINNVGTLLLLGQNPVKFRKPHFRNFKFVFYCREQGLDYPTTSKTPGSHGRVSVSLISPPKVN